MVAGHLANRTSVRYYITGTSIKSISRLDAAAAKFVKLFTDENRLPTQLELDAINAVTAAAKSIAETSRILANVACPQKPGRKTDPDSDDQDQPSTPKIPRFYQQQQKPN